MNTMDEPSLRGGHSPKAIQEASAWLALMHGPRRSADIVNGFRRWMMESPQHKSAFEAVTTMWEMTERLPKRSLPLPRKWQRAGFRAGFNRALVAVAASVALAFGLTFVYLRQAGVATGVGEQRMLTLNDGTRIYLNTDTRVRVDFSDERRSVELKSGEALFEVAKRGPEWPFVVTAGGKQITALGTSFVVRRDSQLVAVTLVEGRVAVAEDTRDAIAASSGWRVLTPGERVIFAAGATPRLDRPEVEKVIAWRRGRVELNDTALADAVAEMNRYTKVKLTIERPEAATLRVKGAFRAGDTLSFAQSVASTCQLQLVRKADGILLSGIPSTDCR